MYKLSTPSSTEAESSTFEPSFCLHAMKRKQQWLHQAARHSGRGSWLTPRDPFREEIWMQKDMLLWAVVWSRHTSSNNQDWAMIATYYYFFSPENMKIPYLVQLTSINVTKSFFRFNFPSLSGVYNSAISLKFSQSSEIKRAMLFCFSAPTPLIQERANF